MGLFPFFIGGGYVAGKKMLKPCPFCGNPNVGVRVYPKNDVDRFRVKYAVLCDYRFDGCGSESGHWPSAEEAVLAWNERRRKWKG